MTGGEGGVAQDTDYAREVGARLRAVRLQQNLSLQMVDGKSAGRLRAVVVGSYERGDRMMTFHRLTELAEFYGVPVPVFLPDGDRLAYRPASADRLVFDLDAVTDAAKLGSLPLERPRPAGKSHDAGRMGGRWLRVAPIVEFLDAVRRWRDDWAGSVLTVRGSDASTLALLCGVERAELVAALTGAGLLASGERLADLVGPMKSGDAEAETLGGDGGGRR